jgi:hypothetical protein
MINKTVCIVENGLFESVAHALVPEFKQVLYFRDSNQSFPTANDLAIGKGYAFERIDKIWPHYDEVDIWIFPDIGYGDFQQWLQSEGKATFGSGIAGEFEQYRVEQKQIIKDCGLPVNPFAVVIGMTDLRDYLQENENVFVKLSMARGVTESFHSANYDLIKVKLDDIEHRLGCLSESQEWIVEQPIESDGEIGYDGVTINGKFWDMGIAGVERKDCGYFCAVRPYRQLPKAVLTVNDALSEQFKEWGYCGWWSDEIRPDKKGKPYLIDPTCRCASPAGEAVMDLISNWGEIIDAGSQGEMVQPKWNGKYAAQAMLVCDEAATQQVPIFVDPKVRSSVKLYHSGIVDGVEVVFPTDAKMAEIGSAVGIGNTPEQAMSMCRKVCDGVEAYGLEKKCDVLEGARKELAKFMPI